MLMVFKLSANNLFAAHKFGIKFKHIIQQVFRCGKRDTVTGRGIHTRSKQHVVELDKYQTYCFLSTAY